MPPRKRKASAGSSSTKLSFLPLLTKPAEAIGDYIKMQGKEWNGCPAADKDPGPGPRTRTQDQDQGPGPRTRTQDIT